VKFMVTLFADAIVEAKAGVLSVAHQIEENEVTMADVIVNVEEQAAESERRRRAKMAERRNQQQNQRGGFNRDRDRGPRRDGDKPRFNRSEPKVEAPVEDKSNTETEDK
jgi:small subunit ribosomal protein S2